MCLWKSILGQEMFVDAMRAKFSQQEERELVQQRHCGGEWLNWTGAFKHNIYSLSNVHTHNHTFIIHYTSHSIQGFNGFSIKDYCQVQNMKKVWGLKLFVTTIKVYTISWMRNFKVNTGQCGSCHTADTFLFLYDFKFIFEHNLNI